MGKREALRNSENKELERVIDIYKSNTNQDNYNEVLKKLFTDIDQELIIPSVIRKDNNGFDLKSIFDENDNWYLVSYTSNRYVTESDESFLIMKLEGVLIKVLENEKCSGLIINPDIKINSSNEKKQCIIPKEYIIKIYSN